MYASSKSLDSLGVADCVPVTKLADKLASSGTTPNVTKPTSPPPPERVPSSRGKGKAPVINPEQTPGEIIGPLRSDLATTQKARASLQSQVDELTSSIKALELQSKSSAGQITQLNRQKTDLERKLRDREEEIRQKTKLAIDAQDEMVAQGLQMNLAEQKSEKLQKDNKELLDRWMRAKREEADRMNRDSRWE